MAIQVEEVLEAEEDKEMTEQPEECSDLDSDDI